MYTKALKFPTWELDFKNKLSFVFIKTNAMQKQPHHLQDLSNKQVYLNYLQKKGKRIYGADFKIQKPLLNALLAIKPYLLKENRLAVHPKKGLLLLGSSRSGKTTFMVLIRDLFTASEKYHLKSCLEIEHQILKYGAGYLNDLLQTKEDNWCFDDFGARTTHNHSTTMKQLIEKLQQRSEIDVCHIVSSISLEQILLQYGFVFYTYLLENYIIINIY